LSVKWAGDGLLPGKGQTEAVRDVIDERAVVLDDRRLQQAGA